MPVLTARAVVRRPRDALLIAPGEDMLGWRTNVER